MTFNMLILRDSISSRGVIFAHRGCRCRLCENGYDVWYWSLVGFIINMQIFGNSIASGGVFSPAVWLRLSWMVRSRRPSSCAFSCIHCFVSIFRDVAFRLRGRRHEFLVARLLCCRCLVLSPTLRTCRLKWLGHLKKLKNNAFVGYAEYVLITRSTFLVQKLGRQEVLLVGWPRSADLCRFQTNCCLVNGLIEPSFVCFHPFQSVSQAIFVARFLGYQNRDASMFQVSSYGPGPDFARHCLSTALRRHGRPTRSKLSRGGLGSVFISHAAGILIFRGAHLHEWYSPIGASSQC